MQPSQTGSTAMNSAVSSTQAKTAVKKASATKAKPTVKASSAVKKSAVKSSSKALATHPKYIVMITRAINELKERNGSSRQAILKFIGSKFNVGGADDKHVQSQLKMALKRGVTSGLLKQSKGAGASGSFRVNAEVKKVAKPRVMKKSVVKKASPSKAVGGAVKAKKPVTTKAATSKPKKVIKRPDGKVAAIKKTSTTAVKKGVTKKTAVAKPKVTKPKAVAAKSSPKAASKPKVAVVKAKKVAVKKTTKSAK